MPDKNPKIPPIFIVSGGKGLAAHTMIESLLVQYPKNQIPIKVFPRFSSIENIHEVVQQAKDSKAIIAHTLVSHNIRENLIKACNENNIKQIDYMGPLATYIENELGLVSIDQPGLFRSINAPYFQRIEAMEFTLDHDDGLDPGRIKEADIVLTGVSRAGKTPLSVYMSMFGWKVANVPLVYGIDPPKELFEADAQRVFGLKITSTYLIPLRTKRLKTFNQKQETNYIDQRNVNQELQFASRIFEKGGFTVINVVNKPIETSANEIASIISERFGFDTQKNMRISF